MKHKWIWLLGALLVLLLSVSWYYLVKVPEVRSHQINSFEECIKVNPVITLQYPTRCTTPDGRVFTDPAATITPTAQVANPASVYCEQKGGKINIIEEEPGQGGQVGMCMLPAGKVCEEWAYYRGECK